MFYELLNRTQTNVLLELEGLDYAAGLREQFRLNKSPVRVSSVPLFADWDAHQSFELLSRLELRWQLLHHVLTYKLAISVLCVNLHSLHF